MDSQTDPSRQIDEQKTRRGPGEPMSQNRLFVISSDLPRLRLIPSLCNATASVTEQFEVG